MENETILETNDNDVVSGRGSGGNRHPGNIYFRELIKSNKAYYLSLGKNQKMDVARAIYDKISSLDPPGRFLNKNPETDKWFVIKKDRALEKISQALREKPSSTQRKSNLQAGLTKFDQPAFLIPRGIPLQIGASHAVDGSDNLYTTAPQRSNLSFNPTSQNQDQVGIPQKLQYQHQMKMMDMMQTGGYMGPLPQTGLYPSVTGPSFGLYHSQYPINSVGYGNIAPFAEHPVYADRVNFLGDENQRLSQSQQPVSLRSGFSIHQQAPFSGSNVMGMNASNPYASMSMSDYHQRMMSVPSVVSGSESLSIHHVDQNVGGLSVQRDDQPKKLEVVLPARDSVKPILHQIKDPLSSSQNQDHSSACISDRYSSPASK